MELHVRLKMGVIIFENRGVWHYVYDIEIAAVATSHATIPEFCFLPLNKILPNPIYLHVLQAA